ncbi:YlbL family protein [Pseudonocardia bannensis]|uniref:endopeptidase La n=1 Tax=Pseudonocardia bannensis TaxID=630973 RepID=A0A848DPR7_9PSEU|nr:PDZ domain-containing protein [Pseudonocardia bannensis]NMH94840.1 PDZ domain-containing protein [Pseudonocardia bannensis]
MKRRTLTLVAAGLLAAMLALLGVTLQVPLVALGPGPTFDTLGVIDGTEVVEIDGREVYPTTGRLNMTTVSVSDRLTALTALGFWIAGERRVVPRDSVFPPDKTDEQVQEENTLQFSASEVNAEVAAMSLLGVPTRVVVAEIVPDSPAAGVLQQGDELVTVAGRAVDTPTSVSDALSATTPGQRVTITYRRAGEQRDTDIVLGSSPDRAQGLLGVRPGAEPREGDITISLGDIGGPSAGLMFALAVVDKLTPGDLTGGAFVAGTGAITQQGVVQPIGGIPFKMRAARDAGATVFLVPAENCAEAAANAPDGLQLIKVADLQGAVSGLDAVREGKPAPACT